MEYACTTREYSRSPLPLSGSFAFTSTSFPSSLPCVNYLGDVALSHCSSPLGNKCMNISWKCVNDALTLAPYWMIVLLCCDKC